MSNENYPIGAITGEIITQQNTQYANTDDLAIYLHIDSSALSTDCPRLIDRASEIVDYYIGCNLDTTNTTQMTACKNAVCSQVEYWLTSGEDSELSGGIKQFSASKLSITYQDGGKQELAPRAYKFLFMAGLLYRGASTV